MKPPLWRLFYCIQEWKALSKNGPFSPSKKSVLLIVLLLSIAITFETFQQIYYIKRFQLLQDIRFFEVLKNQFYRWVIWMLLGGLLLPIANKNSSQVFQKFTDYKDYVFSIIGLVILNIFIIGIIQLLINGDSLTLSSFWNEYFSFFLYQKAPNGLDGFFRITFNNISKKGFNWLGEWVDSAEKIKFPTWKIYCTKED